MSRYLVPGSMLLNNLQDLLGGNNAAAVDNSGESVFTIGVIRWLTGYGTTKVISSAGGKIFLPMGAVTNNNGGTSSRIGIQDYDGATGAEDGTFDTHVDVAGGSGLITANAINAFTLASGSKSIAHGDVVAIGLEMISRGGADSISLRFGASASGSFATPNFPYSTRDSGAGPVKQQAIMPVTILADDGTPGWIIPVALTHQFWASIGAVGYNVNSTPDEYAVLVTFPFPCEIDMYVLGFGLTSAAATYEPLIYTDPEGTPAIAPRTPIPTDPDLQGQAYSGGVSPAPYTWAIEPYAVRAGQTLGFAARPTSANNVRMGYYDLGSSTYLPLKGPSLFTSVRLAARTNQSGPFTVVQDYYNPLFVAQVAAIGGSAGVGRGIGRGM